MCLSSWGQVFPGGVEEGWTGRAGLGPGHPVSVSAFVPPGKSPLLHQEGRERMTQRSLKALSAMTCVATSRPCNQTLILLRVGPY